MCEKSDLKTAYEAGLLLANVISKIKMDEEQLYYASRAKLCTAIVKLIEIPDFIEVKTQ